MNYKENNTVLGSINVFTPFLISYEKMYNNIEPSDNNCNEMSQNLKTSISKINQTNDYTKETFSFPDKTSFIFNPVLCDGIDYLTKTSLQNNISIKFSKSQYFTHYAYSIKYEKETHILNISQFSN